MMNTLGNRISDLRRQHKMTQDELALQMNVSSQAVSKWENDLSIPDLPILMKLADFFHVSLDELVRPQVEKVSYVPNETRKSIEQMVLRIHVISAQNDKVKINLPMKMVKFAMEMGMSLPQFSGNRALDGIDLNMVMEMIEQGVVGKLVEVESADGDFVEISVE